MSDPMEGLLDVRDDLDRATQRYERAAAARTAIVGSDADGAVSVTVRPDGRLDGIRVRADWATRIDSDALGAAVVAAVTDAATRSALEWGTALADGLEAPAPRTRPLPSPVGSLAAGLDDVVSTRSLADYDRPSLEAMAEVLERMLAEVDQVADEVEAVGRRRVVGRAPGTDVTVTLSGVAAVLDVTVGTAATRHHAANISRFLLDAYADALRQVGGQPAEDVVERSVFGELRRIGNAPTAVASRFRAF
jgi:DNA-binding protein YbaB